MFTGISTASLFGRELLEENLKEIGRQGIGHAEVFLNTFCEYREPFVKKLRRIADDLGISIHSLHPYGVQFEPQLFSGYERTLADALGIFEQVLAAAKVLGAGVYVFHGGIFYKPATHHRHNYDRIGKALDRILALAAQYEITIAYENVHWCWFHCPEFGRKILKHIQSEQLAFTLDIKQAAQSGFDPLMYLEVMKGRLANVHICDFMHCEEGRLKTCLPFQGEMDFSALRQALRAAEYCGPIMLEVYRQDYQSKEELFDCYQKVEQFFNLPVKADIS